MALTPEQIKNIRQQIGFEASGPQDQASNNIARRRELAQQYDEKSKQEPNYFQRVWNRWTEGAKDLITDVGIAGEQARQASNAGDVGGTLLNLGRGSLRTVGEVAEQAFTPIMEAPGVKEGVAGVGEFVGNNPLANLIKRQAQKFSEANPEQAAKVKSGVNQAILSIDKLAKENPELMKDIQNFVDIAGLGAGGVGERVSKEALSTIDDIARQGIGNVKQEISRIGESAKQGLKPVTETAEVLKENLKLIPGRVGTNIESKVAVEQAIKELPTEIAKVTARQGVDITDVKTLLEIPVNQAKSSVQGVKQVLTSVPKEQANLVKQLFERVKNYSKFKTGPRPEEIVGKPIVEALKKAESLKKTVGVELGDVAKNLGVVTREELVPTVFQRLKQVPGLDGLRVSDKGILNFSDTVLASSLSKADRVAIQKAFQNATKWGDGIKLHRFRQELFEILGGKKKSLANITDTQERAYEAIRSGLSDVLETKNSAYKALSNEYRKIVQPLSDMRKFFKSIPDATEDILEMNAGLLARRMTSNAPSGVQVKNILRSLDDVLKGKYAVSTEKLQDIYNVLSRYYDISAPTGFRGNIEGAIDTSISGALGKIKELGAKTVEVRQKAIEDLINSIYGKSKKTLE